MTRLFLRSKIHRATVTEANVDYEGSITIDRDFLEASGIRPYEKVEVYNVTLGTRLETYAIEGEPGQRDICLNGAAAHLVNIGDKIIICCYANFEEHELDDHKPTLVFLGENNVIKSVKNAETAMTVAV